MNDQTPLHREVKERIITLILGGFGLVAALAWNDAIRSTFDSVLPPGKSLLAKFLYAILITAIVVFVSRYFLKQSQEKTY